MPNHVGFAMPNQVVDRRLSAHLGETQWISGDPRGFNGNPEDPRGTWGTPGDPRGPQWTPRDPRGSKGIDTTRDQTQNDQNSASER